MSFFGGLTEPAHGLGIILGHDFAIWHPEVDRGSFEVLILDKVFASLPTSSFTDDKKKAVAADV